jgi:hypothetical protein
MTGDIMTLWHKVIDGTDGAIEPSASATSAPAGAISRVLIHYVQPAMGPGLVRDRTSSPLLTGVQRGKATLARYSSLYDRLFVAWEGPDESPAFEPEDLPLH